MNEFTETGFKFLEYIKQLAMIKLIVTCPQYESYSFSHIWCEDENDTIEVEYGNKWYDTYTITLTKEEIDLFPTELYIKLMDELYDEASEQMERELSIKDQKERDERNADLRRLYKLAEEYNKEVVDKE